MLSHQPLDDVTPPDKVPIAADPLTWYSPGLSGIHVYLYFAPFGKVTVASRGMQPISVLMHGSVDLVTR